MYQILTFVATIPLDEKMLGRSVEQKRQQNCCPAKDIHLSNKVRARSWKRNKQK